MTWTPEQEAKRCDAYWHWHAAHEAWRVDADNPMLIHEEAVAFDIMCAIDDEWAALPEDERNAIVAAMLTVTEDYIFPKSDPKRGSKVEHLP